MFKNGIKLNYDANSGEKSKFMFVLLTDIIAIIVVFRSP